MNLPNENNTNNSHEIESENNTVETFQSKAEKKKFKKIYKSLSKEKKSDLSHIENEILSRREEILLVQTYFKAKFWKDLAWLTLSALLITIAFDYFISVTGRTGLFPAGIAGLARFFAVLTFQDQLSLQSSFYFIYYFIINIPLFIFGRIKLGKKFTYTSMLYILLQIVFNQIIQLIPIINPNSFHFIINYELHNVIDGSWNSGLWLFIFAGIGGVLSGTAFSIVYKIGSSAGGTDFLTVYFSKIRNKPIGTLNRDLGFVILGVIIVLNTIIIPVSVIGADIRFNILQNIGFERALTIYDINDNDLITSMLLFVKSNGAYTNGNWDPSLLFNLGVNSNNIINQSPQEVLDIIFRNISEGTGGNFSQASAFDYLVQYATRRGYGDELPLAVTWRIKISHIFGPSLFASIILLLCSAITTNALYPRHKVRTYLITTNKPKKINQTLLKSGFQNDIVTWEATNRINQNYLHRSVIMVVMSVMDWNLLEKQLFLEDPHIKVNVLKTKDIKGIFNYEIKTNDERDIIHKKVTNDAAELEKIRQIAIVKYNKYNKNKKNKQNKNKKDEQNDKPQ